jgi:hypothetical protein
MLILSFCTIKFFYPSFKLSGGILDQTYLMHSKAIIFGYFVLAGLWLTACSGNVSEKTRITLLTREGWKFKKIGVESEKQGYIDLLDSRVSDFEKDDITIFNPDGSGMQQTGSIKSDPSDPPSLPFNWSFENNASGIYFEEQHFKVKTLSENKLEIYRDERLDGEDRRYVIAFSH